MALVALLGVSGIGLIWLGGYTARHYGPARGTPLFWLTVIEKVLGWLLLALAVMGVLGFFFLGRQV